MTEERKRQLERFVSMLLSADAEMRRLGMEFVAQIFDRGEIEFMKRLAEEKEG